MKHDILLATSNRSLANNFQKALSERIKLDTIDTPAKLNRLFRKRGEMLEVRILDLTFPDKELNRFIFYIKQIRPCL